MLPGIDTNVLSMPKLHFLQRCICQLHWIWTWKSEVIVDSAFVFWYGHFIHLHTVIDVLPSWFKDSHKFLKYSCQSDSWIFWYCLALRWVCVYWFVLFYFIFFFPIFWLFYFSTLAVIDCLIEVQSFAIPEPRSFSRRCGWRRPPLGWFSVSVGLCALLLLSVSL